MLLDNYGQLRTTKSKSEALWVKYIDKIKNLRRNAKLPHFIPVLKRELT